MTVPSRSSSIPNDPRADGLWLASRAVPPFVDGMENIDAVREELIGMLGPEQVANDAATLETHAADRWMARGRADLVVFARHTQDVSRVMHYCSTNNIPVTPRGAGVGYVGGATPVQGGLVLSLARMNRILEIHPEDFVAVVEPCVITGELQSACRQQGLFYPPDPASLKECSIGGNISTNAGGPRCLKYGVTRNYVLGLQVVLPDGRILEAGGRTHKNKTGFDLVGMFVGAEGLLGIVTRATLRLLPHPPQCATLSAAFPTPEAACAAVQAVLHAGFLPSALEVADGFTLQAAREFVGASRGPSGDAHLLVELDGQEATVQTETNMVAAILRNAGALELETAQGETESARLWELRRLFSQSLKASGLVKLNEDVTVPRSRLVDLMRFAGELQQRFDVPVATFGHAGDGNLHVNLMVKDYDDAAVKERMMEALDALFQQIIEWGGAVTGEHGIGVAKMRWWPKALPEVTRDFHDQLKQFLDPAGVLNPGKFVKNPADRKPECEKTESIER